MLINGCGDKEDEENANPSIRIYEFMRKWCACAPSVIETNYGSDAWIAFDNDKM